MDASVTGTSDNLAALGTLASIAQREDTMMRETAGARRAGIATVLGFNGVLVGLGLFAAGSACSADGVMVGSGLLVHFAVAAALAIVCLTIAAAALLVALWSDEVALLDEDSVKQLDEWAEALVGGARSNPPSLASQGIRLLTGEKKLLAAQREIAAKQATPTRVGLAGTGLGIGLLGAAGLIVVAEILFG